MIDLNEFIANCQQALEQTDPVQHVKELVKDVIADPAALMQAFDERAAGEHRSLENAIIFRSETLSVLDVANDPGLKTPAHDHKMWAVIGVYDGEEPNEFFLAKDKGLEHKSSRLLKVGDVAALDGDTIHAIANPKKTKSYAIHVYGGDIVKQRGRSIWNPHTIKQEPYDVNQLTEYVKEMSDAPVA
ncbi:MAG: hypothetical protein KUG79_11285 [Pseudomonadales bacterium]|nr:hypothetical protein [Pseudomonadales bacterium]